MKFIVDNVLDVRVRQSILARGLQLTFTFEDKGVSELRRVLIPFCRVRISTDCSYSVVRYNPFLDVWSITLCEKDWNFISGKCFPNRPKKEDDSFSSGILGSLFSFLH